MVVEADESDGSFLKLPADRRRSSPTWTPSTWITGAPFDAMKEGFRTSSSSNIPFYGFAVLCMDHPDRAGR